MTPEHISPTVDYDETITSMIESLIEVMYEPITITSIPKSREVGTQAGLTCMECGFRFFSNSSLHRHMNFYHSTVTFKCEICSAVYHKMDSMLYHMKKVHVIRTSIKNK